MRAFFAVVSVAGLVFLIACGGGGTPAGVPITITLSAGTTTLNPGQSTTITAAVANDSSNKGVTWSVSPSGFGTLSNQTSTSVTYTAPASVPTATTVTITATSVASPSVMATVQIAVQTSAITIALTPAAPQTINQGGTLSVTAKLTNDTSNKSVTWSLSPQVGSLSGQTSTTVKYNAPTSVTSNTPVTLIATSVASSNTTATLEITVFPSGAGPNVAALTVDPGPAPSTNASANTPYVSVTICVPGTQNCQTVDHIEVDTGSSGLRILQSVIPGLALPTLTDGSNGNTIFNCVQFLDTSYLWGPVQQAEVEIGGEVAGSSTPLQIQTISSSNTGVPTACSNGGTVNENTPQLLEANGILGVGLEPTDCFAQGLLNLCDGSQGNPIPAYFDCPSSGCASNATQITIQSTQQVTNPVTLFADNNGVVLQLPAVTSTAPTVSGSLIFGINTQTNNALGSATVFPLSNDNFTTTYSNQSLTASFIDSGSNALFFPSTITACTDNSFYCPASLTAQSATNVGAGGSPSNLVTFDVDNADSLFTTNPSDAAFGTLAGPQGTANTCTNSGTGSCTFDWGLPFFYGRTVFTAIDGQTVANAPATPFWAY